MIVTNKYGLPEPLLRFARNDKYSKGRADYSVTELISPPQLALLKRRHGKDAAVDASDMIWQLLGTAVHSVLETGGRDEITEERLYSTVYGAVVSGAMDIQKHGAGLHIIDWKVTSVFSAMSEKPEWEYQLNCYAYLVEKEKKTPVRKLSICAIMRDWRGYEARTKRGYPPRPAMMIDIPLWDFEEREEFLRSRIKLHTEAEMHHDLGEDLPPCTNEEMWLRDEQWAVHKPDAKRAAAVFPTQSQATEYAEAGKGLSVTHRPGRRVRCEEFCPVSAYCQQHAKQKERERGQEGETDQA